MGASVAGELAGTMTMAIIGVIAFSVIVQLLMAGGPSEDGCSPPPEIIEVERHQPPPIVHQGPVWQNHRLWEDHHTRGQPLQTFYNNQFMEDPRLGEGWENIHGPVMQEFRNPPVNPEEDVAWRLEGGQIHRRNE